jgi:type II secretory pathway pseudopilin PulG
LLVVVLIIGILAAIALPQYRKAVEKSKATSMLHSVKALKPFIEEFYLYNDRLPEKEEIADIINLNPADNSVFNGKLYLFFWDPGNPRHYLFSPIKQSYMEYAYSFEIMSTKDPYNRCINSNKNAPVCILCTAMLNDAMGDYICSLFGRDPFTLNNGKIYTIE